MGPGRLVAFSTLAAFTTYFAMYGFRKPFAAATFAGVRLGPLELKAALAISQIVGYAISKFVGLKVCSEATPGRRARLLVGLTLSAEVALVLFGLLGPQGKVVAIFLNGLPLGMVWGLVVGYLEGRRTSELLLAGLSCSYILASSVVKDVGRNLMAAGVPEGWMPAATGLCFLPVYLLGVWMLERVPPPDSRDVAERVARIPMRRDERRSFMARFLFGLALLLVVFFVLTAYRDFRDIYAVEILADLGHREGAALLTAADAPAALGTLTMMGLLFLVRDNRRGLIGVYAIMTGGVLLLGGATLALDAGVIGGFTWMVLTGIGCYLAYVPFGSVLFDRMIATTGFAGTAVFGIYLADAVGYTGSIGMQLYKELGQAAETRFEFFRQVTYGFSGLGSVLLVASCAWFVRRSGRGSPTAGPLHRRVRDAR